MRPSFTRFFTNRSKHSINLKESQEGALRFLCVNCLPAEGTAGKSAIFIYFSLSIPPLSAKDEKEKYFILFILYLTRYLFALIKKFSAA